MSEREPKSVSVEKRKRRQRVIAGAIVVGLVVASVVYEELNKTSQSSSSSVPTTEPSVLIGHQTQFEGCVAIGNLPDADCTPGAVVTDATKDKICTPGYATTVRNVTESVKKRDYAEYGITARKAGQYEIDHLISLELGGTNDIANLWPEPAQPEPGFHQKNKVENYLHKQVCDGLITLAVAQQEVASNWVAVFETMPVG